MMGALPPLASLGLIADYTYERRAEFMAGLSRLAGSADAQIQQLNTRRATLPGTSAQDWDVAMKELTDARSDLQFKITALNASTAEMWSQTKDNATRSWKRVEDASDRVRHSTTL